MLQQVGSGISFVLERIQNLCLPNKQPAAATPAQPSPDLHERMLKAALADGAKSILNSIQAMSPLLHSEALSPDGLSNKAGATFVAQFRNLGVGLRAFNLVADDRVAKGLLPASVADAVSLLVHKDTVIADGMTEGALFARLSNGDFTFLSEAVVLMDLQQHFRNARNAAVDCATRLGEHELAQQLDALCRNEPDFV
jgi:hypothetical protein